MGFDKATVAARGTGCAPTHPPASPAVPRQADMYSATLGQIPRRNAEKPPCLLCPRRSWRRGQSSAGRHPASAPRDSASPLPLAAGSIRHSPSVTPSLQPPSRKEGKPTTRRLIPPPKISQPGEPVAAPTFAGAGRAPGPCTKATFPHTQRTWKSSAETSEHRFLPCRAHSSRRIFIQPNLKQNCSPLPLFLPAVRFWESPRRVGGEIPASRTGEGLCAVQTARRSTLNKDLLKILNPSGAKHAIRGRPLR